MPEADVHRTSVSLKQSVLFPILGSRMRNFRLLFAMNLKEGSPARLASKLSVRFTTNAITVVLKKNDRRPCNITVRRVSREVMLMLEVWAVVPITSDK